MRRRLKHSIKTLFWITGTAASLFSVICTFLGIAPDQAVENIIGHGLFSHLQYLRSQVLGMTADQARWALVISGDLFFGVAVWFFLYVRLAGKMARTHPSMGELSDMEARLRQKLSETNTELTENLRVQEVKVAEVIKTSRDRHAEAS